MQTTLSFALEKETKGAVRYIEIKDNPLAEGVVGTLYIRKAAFAAAGLSTPPQSLTVTINA